MALNQHLASHGGRSKGIGSLGGYISDQSLDFPSRGAAGSKTWGRHMELSCSRASKVAPLRLPSRESRLPHAHTGKTLLRYVCESQWPFKRQLEIHTKGIIG